MKLAHLVAIDQGRVIGNEGKLPWHISNDLKRFKALTMGHVIIMGRKTFDSIGRALPGRHCIVISRNQSLDLPDGVALAASLDEAIELVSRHKWPADEVFIIGGGEIYGSTMDRADRIYLTQVKAVFPGDAFYPVWSEAAFKVTAREDHDEGPLPYSFLTLDRQ